MTFEQYLRSEVGLGKVDFRLRAHVTDDGVQFYIHPYGADGKTADYAVGCNKVTLKFTCGEDVPAPWLTIPLIDPLDIVEPEG